MTLNEPNHWFFDDPKDQGYYKHRRALERTRIVWEDQVCEEIPDSAVESVRQVSLRDPDVERVYRDDDETVVIHWYDNVEADAKTSEVPDYSIAQIRQSIRTLFGPFWRTERKLDGRFSENRHPQKAVVRRIKCQRFRYPDESESDWLLALHGRHDEVPEDISTWGDMEQYHPPECTANVPNDADIYVYVAPSGTKHLIPARRQYGKKNKGLRYQGVHDGPAAMCGTRPNVGTVAKGDRLIHYSESVKDAYVSEYDSVLKERGPLSPSDLFDDDLCGRCHSVYTNDQGEPPQDAFTYRKLLGDDDE